MTAVLILQPEDVARILEIQKEERELSARLDILLSEGEKIIAGTEHTEKPMLKFDKNVIRWDGGTLAIRGKGYALVKILYESKTEMDEMVLDIATLEDTVWKDDVDEKGKALIRQNTFRVALLRFAEILERAKFPYKLLPVRSQEIREITPNADGKKPLTKRIQSRIIGAKLGVTVCRQNVTPD
jgi:hypothetical protein